MKSYLITYTLESFDKTFPVISEKIMKFPKWARISNYTWIIQAEENESKIRDDLRVEISGEGSILVIDVSNSSWATYAVNKNVTEWMKENV